MEFVGTALKALIDNLVPNGNNHYVNSDWVLEELQPLLTALNQKASNNLHKINDTDSRHNLTLIFVMISRTGFIKLSRSNELLS